MHRLGTGRGAAGDQGLGGELGGNQEEGWGRGPPGPWVGAEDPKW